MSRAKGHSAVKAAAYRSASRLLDERTGEWADWRAKGGVVHTEIIVPAGSPAWAKDRSALWNAAEKAEDKSTRRNEAKTGRDFIVDLPHELSADARAQCVREFAQYLCDTYGMAVDYAIHLPDAQGDQRNHHAHVLTSTRRLTDAGFGAKIRELDSKTTSGPHLKAIREKWADIANAAYQREGLDIRIDASSYEARGIDQEPTIHLGPNASQMEREGVQTELGDKNREIAARNAERAEIKTEIAVIGQEIRDEAEARADRQADRELQSAVRTFDAGKILAALTERRATFSRGDLNHALKGAVEDKNERAEVVGRILADREVIGLRETADSPVTRYTTRTILAGEMGAMQAARRMGAASHSGLAEWQLAAVLDQHAHLDQEQRAAFDRATGAGGFAMIAGEAGTGKSTTMNAIRDAYTEGGYRVIGLARTNAVMEDMAGSGFAEARTIDRELSQVENGRSVWNRRTVVMVDEAGMIGTQQLAALLTKAAETGAKVILTGDDAQLASIEYGGLFGALRMEHGAAVLTQVRRVSDAEERRAWNKMHGGDFRPMLDLLDRKGAIHWGQTDEDARAALVAKYAADTAGAPEKARFVFANSNKEVAALNGDIRAIRRERGELGEDRLLHGADGATAFAKGDRIQFTGNARTQAARDAGFTNGRVGTILEIDGQRVTVQLDAKGKGPGKVVAFTAGEDDEAGQFHAFRHGYAGTIYKGQGKTLDQTYVLHSASMGAASSYVGLSRHREGVSLFTTRGADAWMMAGGGLDGLTAAQRKSAEGSYNRWEKANPKIATRFGIGEYVAYVQEQQAKRDAEGKGDRSHDLARLARQMGRVEDRRSASQFQPSPVTDTGSFGGAAKRATGPQERHEDAEGMDAPAEAGNAPTARQRAAAHGVGARIAAMRNPFAQAQALHRAHVRDAHARRLDELRARQAAADQQARQDEARRQSQLEREDMRRDLAAKRAAEQQAESRPQDATKADTPRKPETLAEQQARLDADYAAMMDANKEQWRDRGRTR